jgi:hypothetical protein
MGEETGRRVSLGGSTSTTLVGRWHGPCVSCVAMLVYSRFSRVTAEQTTRQQTQQLPDDQSVSGCFAVLRFREEVHSSSVPVPCRCEEERVRVALSLVEREVSDSSLER